MQLFFVWHFKCTVFMYSVLFLLSVLSSNYYSCSSWSLDRVWSSKTQNLFNLTWKSTFTKVQWQLTQVLKYFLSASDIMDDIVKICQRLKWMVPKMVKTPKLITPDSRQTWPSRWYVIFFSQNLFHATHVFQKTAHWLGP